MRFARLLQNRRALLAALVSTLALAITALGLPVCLAQAAEESGFEPIFDGKSLEGWDGNPDFWRVEDGAIVGQTTPEKPTRGNTFLVWRKGQVGDFELVLEYRIQGGNSGIQYRSREEPEKWGRWVIGGYQADIDAANTFTGILYGERDRGILCGRGQKVVIGPDHKPKVVGKLGDPAELVQAIRKDDWNQYRIVARGFHFIHEINGVVMADITDEDVEMRKAAGLLALQLHAGPPMKVQFRDIRLKRLGPVQAAAPSSPGNAGKKRVVFVAGRRSHGYGSHEHYAGCALLAGLLNRHVPGIDCVVYRDGWPQDPKAFEGASAIVIFSDGGGGHPMLPHLDQLESLMQQGVGLALLHYAVEVPKEPAGKKVLQWVGGYFEQYWSVNPFWTAEFKSLPDHPIARGVKPFAIEDEWYYHMRFVEGMKGVTPILTAIPPESTRNRPDGPHSGNPVVRARKGMPEHVAWAFERPGGGRGFGFTGGHFHWNWAHDDFRTVVLNAIVWVAGMEVPSGGVRTPTPSFEELEANQDYPRPKNFDRKHWEQLIRQWNAP